MIDLKFYIVGEHLNKIKSPLKLLLNDIYIRQLCHSCIMNSKQNGNIFLKFECTERQISKIHNILRDYFQHLIDNKVLNPFFLTVNQQIGNQDFYIMLYLQGQHIIPEEKILPLKEPAFCVGNAVSIRGLYTWPMWSSFWNSPDQNSSGNGFAEILSVRPDTEGVTYEVKFKKTYGKNGDTKIDFFREDQIR